MDSDLESSHALSLEFKQAKKELNELKIKASKSELIEQELRNSRNKTDNQLAIFNDIHKYSILALDADTKEKLSEYVVEGIIYIFQLEVAAVFKVDIYNKALILSKSHNLGVGIDKIDVSDDWLKTLLSWNSKEHTIGYEHPITDSCWKNLGLNSIVYMPFFDNERHIKEIAIGGISEDNKLFYDFNYKENLSSFVIFCQQINAISNNLTAMEEVRRQTDAKNRFLSNLSHEIRTPMNAIYGMVQLANKSDKPDDIKKFIKQIDSASTHLLSLLTDVLDISKIEEGKLKLAFERFNLPEAIEGFINTIKASANSKKQNLSVNFRGLGSKYFKGDPVKLGQVLINLLSNAVKFTPQGGSITLNVDELSREDNKVFLGFEVKDTGIGLSEDFLRRIFKPFEQADNSISRKHGGTGLGLTISQQIVELMGGHIKAENIKDGGTCFSFCIWLKSDERSTDALKGKDTQTLKSLDFTGKRALIVDDVLINREIATAFTSELGMEIEQAENGKIALDLFVNSPIDYYDFIFMDIQMPVMDGLTATKDIRNSQREDAKTVIILAMTANALTKDIQLAIAAGMNAYISKPIKYDVFVDTVTKAMKLHYLHCCEKKVKKDCAIIPKITN